MARLAAALPPLTPGALRLLRTRAPNPLTTYAAIRADAHRLNVAGSEAADLRRRFNGFYGVRRNGAWRDRFYELFEKAKGAGEDPVEIFELVLRRWRRRRAGSKLRLSANSWRPYIRRRR